MFQHTSIFASFTEHLLSSNKSTSTTFALVHRPQNDPKIHDADSMVFQELVPSQSHKVKSRNDLESELFGNAHSAKLSAGLRDNEGEAAEYGVYFDDTEYDYMQHMRDSSRGNDGEERHIADAKGKNITSKGKEHVRLEDALREASLDDRAIKNEGLNFSSSLLDEDVLPSRNLRRVTYQNQQDVPDALAGFQPDMDPRLREVLEALDDEAYVGEEEEFLES